MQIRCEKCATLYNLDESLIPPQGAPVQCTRCGHVFTAHKPEAAPPPPRTQSYGNVNPRSGTLVFNASDVEAAIRDRQQQGTPPAGGPLPAGTQAAFPAQAGAQPVPRGTMAAFPAQPQPSQQAYPPQPSAAVPRGTMAAFPSQPQQAHDPGGDTVAFGAGQPMAPAFGNMATYPSMPAQEPQRPPVPAQRTGTNTAFGSMAGVNPAYAPQQPAPPAAPQGGTSVAFPQQGGAAAYPGATNPSMPAGPAQAPAYPGPTDISMPAQPYLGGTDPSLPQQGYGQQPAYAPQQGYGQQPAYAPQQAHAQQPAYAPQQAHGQPPYPQQQPHMQQPQGHAPPPHAQQGPPPQPPSQVQGFGHAPPQPPHAPSQVSGIGAPPRPRTSPTNLARPPVRTAARSTSTGEFEAQMVARARRRVIVLVGLAVIAVLVVLGVMVGPSLLEGHHDPAAVAKVQSALETMVKGDSASAQQGADLAAEAVAIDAKYRGARATRGMGLYLVAAEIKDRIERLEKQRPGLDKALKKAEDAGDTAEQDRIREQMAQLAAQHTALVNEVATVKGEAEPLINNAYKGAESDPDTIRALGFLRALEGDEGNVDKLAKAYRHEVEAADGWADLMTGIVGAMGKGSPEKRTAAIAALEKALSEAPGMTLAYLFIGRSRLDLDDHAGARAALNEALKATPDSAWAKRVLADVQLAENAAAEKARKKAEAESAPADAAQPPPASDAKPANSEPASR